MSVPLETVAAAPVRVLASGGPAKIAAMRGAAQTAAPDRRGDRRSDREDADRLGAGGLTRHLLPQGGKGGRPPPQHSTKFTASPPSDVSLYFDCMSAPVWRIVAMTLSSETLWRAVAVQRQRGGGDRLDGAEGVALDAGDLHQAADRIAGHAEVMLHARSPPRSRSARWSRRAPRTGPPPPSTQATPTSPWQPTSAPEIEAFILNSAPIAAAVSRNVAQPSGVAPGAMVAVIAQHGGHDAGRAVGRRGDDAAAGGVLLVDRHRIDADEIHDLVGGAGVAAPRWRAGGRRSPWRAADLQPARQLARRGQAAIDASEHRADRPRRDARRPRRAGAARARWRASARRSTGPLSRAARAADRRRWRNG